MRDQFKLWWRQIQRRWTGYRVPVTPFENYFVGRPKLFFLKSRTTLLSLTRRVQLTIKRKARRALRWLGVQKKAFGDARRYWAQVDRRLILLRYEVQSRVAKHSRAIISILLVVAPIVSLRLAPTLQDVVGPYFNSERFAVLRSLLASTGGALIGATAIGFSVVMVAVQLNFARMPHGLFRRLSSDRKLLGAFAGTFLLAIGVSALSIVPDASWAAPVLIAAAWGTILILVLFLYGYRRALYLINPVVQLRLIVEGAQKDLRRWARRAERMAPLLGFPSGDDESGSNSKHDLPRVTFFRANPVWTVTARRAVAHAVSFARRYAEQDDSAVAGSALAAVIEINASYIVAKGKTFFTSNPMLEIPEASDAFINDTLEHLRRLARVTTGRGDEEATRQVLTTMGALVQAYLAIDYGATGFGTKEHAQLAAGYLTAAVEGVLPRNLPDLAMEGIRLMGASARSILVASRPDEITTLVDKIAMFSITGALKPDYRPLTLTGMEQLAQITFDLLKVRAHDIDFAANQLRNSVELVTKVFLEIPDTPLENTHSNYLAPYYSVTKTNTLGDRLTELCNAIIRANKDDALANEILTNFETWSDELYRTQKNLLLLAIEKKSHFTFDLLHWIKRVSTLLVALSKAPAADDFTKEKLEKNAGWLISVVSWIPDDKEAIQFAETFSITEIIFEAALDAMDRDSIRILAQCRDLLIGWAFKAGHHNTARRSFERALFALITLALWKEEFGLVGWLISEIAKRLKQTALKQELLDRTARDLRRQAKFPRRREFELDRIYHAMNQIEHIKVQALMMEIAELLSPTTAGEEIISDRI